MKIVISMVLSIILGWILATKRMESISKDETSRLNESFNSVAGNLHDLAQQFFHLIGSSQKLQTSIGEINQGSGQFSVDLQSSVRKNEDLIRQADYISAAVAQTSAGLGLVVTNVQLINDNNKEVVESAKLGNKEVCKTVAQMDSISKDMANLTHAIELLGKRSLEIGNIIGTITDIANRTNLLSLNAAIEAARTGADVYQEMDKEIEKHMTCEAKLIARILKYYPNLREVEINNLVKEVGVEEIWITNEDGVVVLTNFPGGVGFRFDEEGQAGEFRAILANSSLVVAQPPTDRDVDGQKFKYVGVGREDSKGIIQVGKSFTLRNAELVVAGFTILAEEIRQLADQSQKAAKQIANLITGIQTDINKAVVAMNKSNQEVTEGAKMINKAGMSFRQLLQLVQSISNQAEDIYAAIQQIAVGNDSLVDTTGQTGENIKNFRLLTQEIALAAQAQTVSMKQIAANAEKLTNLTLELDNQIKQINNLSFHNPLKH